MEDLIIGNFYYKKTSNGNLLGEFTNNQNNCIFSESADLESINENGFQGKYLATWQEDNSPILTELTITLKNTKFILKWKLASNVIFFGQGFIVDNILVGYYYNGELENVLQKSNK